MGDTDKSCLEASSSLSPSSPSSSRMSYEESATVLSFSKLTWEYCPPEILFEVLKYLDLQSLRHCFLVNVRWKDIVADYVKFHNLWKDIVTKGMVGMGITYRGKSTLDWKNIVINSLLWNSLHLAQIDHVNSYFLKDLDFSKMQVYKDNLIVKFKDKVKYFNILTRKRIKIFTISENVIDYHENDFMIIKLIEEDRGARRVLKFHGKEQPNDYYINTQVMLFKENVLLFKAEDNRCVIVTTRYIVWGATWYRGKWAVNLIGRHYCNMYDRVYALHIHAHTVYLVTKYGTVFRENKKLKNFEKVISYNVAQSKRPFNWKVFHESDAVVSVEYKSLPNCTMRTNGMKLDVSYNSDHMLIECGDMSCATEHGDMLFLGFRNGGIRICRPYCMFRDSAERREYEVSLRIKSYNKRITHPAILAIDVFEDNWSHHVFVATKHQIFQFDITYPLSLREQFSW